MALDFSFLNSGDEALMPVRHYRLLYELSLIKHRICKRFGLYASEIESLHEGIALG